MQLYVTTFCAALIPLLGCATSASHTVIASDTTISSYQGVDQKEIRDYRSSMSGNVRGSVELFGQVRDLAFTASDTTAKSRKSISRDQSIGGKEGEDACDSDWINSQAAAAASLSPFIDETTRTYGFFTNLSVIARGGSWKKRSGLFCDEVRTSKAFSTAKVVAKIDLTFSRAKNQPEEILIRTSGDIGEHTDIRIYHGENESVSMFQSNADGGIVAVFDHAGKYTILAETNIRSDSDRGCPECTSSKSINYEISVQNLHDAEELGYGFASRSGYELPVPLFIPMLELQSLLVDQFFVENGNRFYPCKIKDGCDKTTAGIYLENPRLSIEDGWLRLTADLAGEINALINAGVSGSVALQGYPMISEDVLTLGALQLETESQDWLVKFASARFGDSLVKKIAADVSVDLKPYLEQAITEIESHFPIFVGPACVLFEFETLVLRKITFAEHPAGLIAEFAATVEPSDLDACIRKKPLN